MEWSRGATIGYNAAGDYYENHYLTGTDDAYNIACLNSPGSDWNNVIYNLSIDVLIPTIPPPTVEPRK